MARVPVLLAGVLRGLVVRVVAGILTGAVLVGMAAAAEPREPDAYPEISRELRIGADVLRAALADAMPEDRRVLDVEAGYLAGQGVLVIVEVARPWFRGDDFELHPEITRLEQIPDMVQDILSEMNLGLSPQQSEDLSELREIRDAARAVRAEQRTIRREIREKRRLLVRAEDDAGADALRAEIDALTRHLAAAEDEEQALETDARTVREAMTVPPRQPADDGAPVSIDQAVAVSVCGYGGTFRTLPDDQHLNLLLQQPGTSRYYVFRMEDVRGCQAGELTAEGLLGEGFVYEP